MSRPLPSRSACTLGLLLVVAACGTKVSADGGEAGPASGGSDPSAVQARELPKVRTTKVRREDMRRVLETTSPVESVSEIDLVAEASGRVLKVLAQEGRRVTAGDLLVQLDDRDQAIALADATAMVAEAEAALERSKLAEEETAARTRSARLALDQAERDYQRNEELAAGEATNPLSKQAVETSRLARDNADEALKQSLLAEVKAKVDTRSADSALDRARLAADRSARDLERTKLSAPITGVIAKRSVEPGSNLSMGEVAFQLTDLDNLRVVFFRPQRELDLFTGGEELPLTATSEARPGFEFQGRIERTSPTIDRASGAFRVTAHLEPVSQPNQDGKVARLLPGMLLRLFVVTGIHENTLVVPKRALRREGANVYLLAVTEGRARRVGVVEGYASDDDVEVTPLGGVLEAGDDVVLVGGRDLEDGDDLIDEADTKPASPDA